MTYSREVQCEIIDSKRLGKIAEEEESDSDDEFDNRFSRIQTQLAPSGRGSIMNRRGSTATGIVEAKRDNSAPSGQGKS